MAVFLQEDEHRSLTSTGPIWTWNRDGFVLESTSPNADIDYRALVSLTSRAWASGEGRGQGQGRTETTSAGGWPLVARKSPQARWLLAAGIGDAAGTVVKADFDVATEVGH